MNTWFEIIDFLQKMGILPIVVLLLAIPGGLLLSLIGAKRFLFAGAGDLVKSSFLTWLNEQKERTKIETKLEERLADLTEQLKQLVSGQWDNRRYIDTVMDEVKAEHKEIITKLDQIITIIPKRKNELPA